MSIAAPPLIENGASVARFGCSYHVVEMRYVPAASPVNVQVAKSPVEV
jgi:hypothetical protein